MNWTIEQSDCFGWLRSLPSDSADLCFTSPPYESARLYLEGGKNLGVARKTEEWVAWMVEVIAECVRVTKGLTAFVVEGQTRHFRYSCGPMLLMADLCRAGFNLRKPPIFHRVGIPGSGGPDWLRNDYEPIICVTRAGKLPWSDNTACGHEPKWAPGGAMSYRNDEGERKNARGFSGMTNQQRKQVHRLRVKGGSPKDSCRGRRVPAGTKVNGDVLHEDAYLPPKLANPGNVIKCIVGGGVMGDELCHENEAPFPEDLAEFFVLSYCPPGGLVIDPFAGSGTTLAVAVKHGRRAAGCDLRSSQVAITKKRIGRVTPMALMEG